MRRYLINRFVTVNLLNICSMYNLFKQQSFKSLTHLYNEITFLKVTLVK